MLIPALLVPLAAFSVLAADTPASARDEHASVSIVVQTDSRGELRPCDCPGSPPSGPALRSGLFQKLRVLRDAAVFLDAGDFSPATDAENPGPLSRLMVEAMELMRYDAVCPGEQELARGAAFLRDAAARLPLVAANLTVEGAPIPAVRFFETGGRRIGVTGIVEPGLFYEWPGAFTEAAAGISLVDPLEALHGLEDTLRAADAVVVLVHAGLDYVRFAGGELDWVDVFVQGHRPELERAPGRMGSAWIVEPGTLSTQIFELKLQWPRGEEGLPAQSEVWLLKQLSRSDGRIERLIKEFEAEHGLPEPPGGG